MIRRCYYASLLLLQLLLMVDAAPNWGRSVAAVTDAISPQGGGLAALALAGAGVTALCSAIVLAAPSLALLRHRQRGPRRFEGIPRWAADVTIGGALVYLAASLPWWFPRLLPVEIRVDALLACEPCLTAGVALMIGGATCAELLRRGVRHVRPRAGQLGIEVVPPEPPLRRVMPIRTA
jgi:hypothetical protein